MPSIWEIPGGGVDDGESIEAALRREVMEETGLLVNNHTLVNSSHYGDTTQYNFHVGVPMGCPPIVLTEHSEYAWVSPDNFEEYLPPGDMILEALLDWKKKNV